MIFLFSLFLAAENQLVTNDGQATAVGIWLLTGFGALAALGITGNAVMGILVKRKQLAAPPIGQQQIITQPLIVALEKEFINRAEYERRHGDVESQVKEVRKYAHDEVHAVRNVLQAMQTAGENRDQLLHALDERTKTHTRTIENLTSKIDRQGDRIADKVEQVLLRRGGGSQ